MSDETSAAISAVRRDWAADHRLSYLRSGGAEGHIMDLTPVGGRSFATHCMIKYVGRKSGNIFITPLCYADIGGEVVICASKGGENVNQAELEEPVWSDEELAGLEQRCFAWIKSLHDLGHKERWWDDANVGDQLQERVFGPHSIASFTTEWRAFIINTWGTMDMRKNDLEALGFTPEMAGYENDPDMQLINPILTDGAYYGPSRGHLFPKYARRIGMPRSYGYGASMGAWVTDYLAGWAGEHGRVVHSIANYRGPALSGDITIQTAEIVDKLVDADGRHLVQVKHKMVNQKGTTLCTGTAEVELPKNAG